MDSLKFCIAGIGNIGGYHAENLLSGRANNASLAAVCDIDGAKREAFASAHPDIPVFSDCSDMISSRLSDAIIVALPHYLHADVTISALEHGLHVICEKPVSVRVSDALRMNRAADIHPELKFAVMFNQRTDPLFAKARELVASGALGERKRLTWIITNWYRTQAYYRSSPWRATWSGEGGGVLLNQAPHNLDLWQWIFGMPDSISAVCTVGKYHDIEVEDDVRITAHYSGGATAEFITSTGEFPGTNRLEMIGDRAKIVLEDNKLKIWRLASTEREVCFSSEQGFADIPFTVEEFAPGETVNGHIAVIENFVAAVQNGAPLVSPGVDAINELTLSNAAYLSDWLGRPVSIPLSPDGVGEFDRLLAERAQRASLPRSPSPTSPSPAQPERWKVRW